jgi:hypothetical protein
MPAASIGAEFQVQNNLVSPAQAQAGGFWRQLCKTHRKRHYSL